MSILKPKTKDCSARCAGGTISGFQFIYSVYQSSEVRRVVSLPLAGTQPSVPRLLEKRYMPSYLIAIHELHYIYLLKDQNLSKAKISAKL